MGDSGGGKSWYLRVAIDVASVDNAGRVYAAYGGVYIAASLLWLWLIESKHPTSWIQSAR